MKRAIVVIVMLAGLEVGAFAQSSVQAPSVSGETAVNNVLVDFLGPIEHDIIVVSVSTQRFLWLLLTLDVVIFGLEIAAGKIDSIGPILMKILALGAIVFVVSNFAVASMWPGSSWTIPASDVQSANNFESSSLNFSPTGDANDIIAQDAAWSEVSAYPQDETALSRHPGLAERFLNMLVGSVTQSSGLNANLVLNPGALLVFAQTQLIKPVKDMEQEVTHYSGFWQAMFAELGVDFHAGVQNIANQSTFGLVPQAKPASTQQAEAATAIGFGVSIYEIGVWIAYTILTIQLCLALIEFYLVLMFAEILVPFIAFEPVRFIGASAFSAVIGQAVRTAIVIAMITLGGSVLYHSVYQNLIANVTHWVPNPSLPMGGSYELVSSASAVEFGDLAIILVSVGLLVYLVLHAPNLALSLLTGTPAFSAPHMFQTAYAGGRLLQAAGGMVSGLAGGIGALAFRGGRDAARGGLERIAGGSADGAASGGAGATASPAAPAAAGTSAAVAPSIGAAEFLPPTERPTIGGGTGGEESRGSGERVVLPAGASALFTPDSAALSARGRAGLARGVGEGRSIYTGKLPFRRTWQ